MVRIEVNIVLFPGPVIRASTVVIFIKNQKWLPSEIDLCGNRI